MEKLSINELNSLSPLQVLEDERARTRFLALCKQRKLDEEEAKSFYEAESWNFSKIIKESQPLQQCTGFSVYGCLLDIATMGLSLENVSQPLLYVMYRGVNLGSNKWEKRAYLEISPYGELALRMQTGQLLYADSPVIVYEGDIFKPIVNEKGQKICIYEAAIPRKSKKIIGSFIRLTRPDSSFDFSYMLPEDIHRLRVYSHRQNSRGKNDNKDHSNALYTSNDGQIDPGFLAAKTIKHAFKTFPKIRMAIKFSKLQEEEIQPIDYGLSEEVPPGMTETRTAPVYEQPEEHAENDPFGGAPVNQPQTVQVEDDDDVF
jgi:recombinational DNA repair protein RecT